MTIPFEHHSFGQGFRAYFDSKKGTIKLSVVAGEYFYSEPRIDLDDPTGYSEIELAIFTPDGQWASYNFLESNGIFDLLGTQGEYSEPSDEPSSNVFGYIPVEKIIELYNKY